MLLTMARSTFAGLFLLLIAQISLAFRTPLSSSLQSHTQFTTRIQAVSSRQQDLFDVQGYFTKHFHLAVDATISKQAFDTTFIEQMIPSLQLRQIKPADYSALLREGDMQTDYVYLLDGAVRHPVSLQQTDSTSASSPAHQVLSQLLQELDQDGSSLEYEKLLYSKELVVNGSRAKVSLARMPVEGFEKLDLSKRLVHFHQHKSPSRVIIMLLSEGRLHPVAYEKLSKATVSTSGKMINALLSAFFATHFQMPTLKSSPAGLPPKQELVLLTPSKEDYESMGIDAPTWMEKVFVKDIRDAFLTSLGGNVARSLASLPPNVLHPRVYVDLLKLFAKHYEVDVEEFTPQQLNAIGCGAFCAVVQGNTAGDRDSEDRLVRLTYSTRKSSLDKLLTLNDAILSAPSVDSDRKLRLGNKPIVFVGKGVCYDTGGLNLKTGNSLSNMKTDMTGSSTALGLFLAMMMRNRFHIEAVEQKETPQLECWLAIAENSISAQSFKPDDVIRAVNGKSIEIINTDAEGRLLLADTISLASRQTNIEDLLQTDSKTNIDKATESSLDPSEVPALVMDFATLTGTAITSLTKRYIGVASNRPDYIPAIIATGRDSGERMWPFPHLDSDMLEDLDSEIADIKQCLPGVEGDHLYASLFLQQFVRRGVPWFHLDLASAYRETGLTHVQTACTGSGVRASYDLLHAVLDI